MPVLQPPPLIWYDLDAQVQTISSVDNGLCCGTPGVGVFGDLGCFELAGQPFVGNVANSPPRVPPRARSSQTLIGAAAWVGPVACGSGLRTDTLVSSGKVVNHTVAVPMLAPRRGVSPPIQRELPQPQRRQVVRAVSPLTLQAVRSVSPTRYHLVRPASTPQLRTMSPSGQHTSRARSPSPWRDPVVRQVSPLQARAGRALSPAQGPVVQAVSPRRLQAQILPPRLPHFAFQPSAISHPQSHPHPQPSGTPTFPSETQQRVYSFHAKEPVVGHQVSQTSLCVPDTLPPPTLQPERQRLPSATQPYTWAAVGPAAQSIQRRDLGLYTFLPPSRVVSPAPSSHPSPLLGDVRLMPSRNTTIVRSSDVLTLQGEPVSERSTPGSYERRDSLELIVEKLETEQRRLAQEHWDHVQKLEAAQAKQAVEHREQIERILETWDPPLRNPFASHGSSIHDSLELDTELTRSFSLTPIPERPVLARQFSLAEMLQQDFLPTPERIGNQHQQEAQQQEGLYQQQHLQQQQIKVSEVVRLAAAETPSRSESPLSMQPCGSEVLMSAASSCRAISKQVGFQALDDEILSSFAQENLENPCLKVACASHQVDVKLNSGSSLRLEAISVQNRKEEETTFVRMLERNGQPLSENFQRLRSRFEATKETAKQRALEVATMGVGLRSGLWAEATMPPSLSTAVTSPGSLPPTPQSSANSCDQVKPTHHKLCHESDSDDAQSGVTSPITAALDEAKLASIVQRMESQLGLLEEIIILERAVGNKVPLPHFRRKVEA